MEVKRIDSYSFKVTLTPDELTALSLISKELGCSYEVCLGVFVENSLESIIDNIKKERSGNELERKD